MTVFGDHWEYLMICISATVACSTFVIFFFLVADPEEVGIVIEEYTEKEAVIDSVTAENSVKSIVHTASPQELKDEI